MPRKKSENTEAVNIKIPKSWIKRAEKLGMAAEPEATRSAILRLAMSHGLDMMEGSKLTQGKKTKS